MLKYKTIIVCIATIASAIFAFWIYDEQYLAYFVVNSLVFGAITGVLITIKMMASNTGKIDPKNLPRMSDFGGGGGEG
tara:strand:+ start:1473 stop:1706 length:234 start_codon:yes stop_codon:yes gene_type:complete